MSINVQTKPEIQVEQRFQLSEIARQGQYVNTQTGHLLVVDEHVEKALENGSNLFKCFIAKDPASLEYLKVSQNPQLSVEEMRTKVASLNLTIGF
jgi:hypothetical protein